ncbi:MAG: SsrA-binding protein SmpB [Candidatus Tectomicrobia bacterium]|nr:SsrA-binding protein SmpB [Candidatus Tectomicrobia bacterium]
MAAKDAAKNGVKIICQNKKARFEYEVIETLEAGLALQGTEVKSLREGRANLADSYAVIEDGEVILLNCHISPYAPGNIHNHNPLRPRKLLLHKREIRRLYGKLAERGLTAVPLRLYFRNGLAKAEIALVRGKKLYDKRETIKRRDAQRDIERVFRRSQRGGK